MFNDINVWLLKIWNYGSVNLLNCKCLNTSVTFSGDCSDVGCLWSIRQFINCVCPNDSFILGQIVAVSTKLIFTYLTSGPQEFHIHSYWQAYLACCLCSYPWFESLESSVYTLSPQHASVSDYYPNFPSLINSSLSSQIPLLVLCQQILLMSESSFFVLLTVQDQHVHSSWWYLYISISGCPVSTTIFEIRVNNHMFRVLNWFWSVLG